ncbi:hypothetical protein CY652_17745 [Burkholderia sp. WAC0059]|uniref:gamma-glutamyl-gamma-aminobutyrate hydrolase family protein n=1 Tax=Burkholderia sp. WAC0059 TaxID=2066022 RepID=UPI000C7EF153|nr:type 1 glutamine amidotransferase [Burkholderia sp. WAC0059]PLZ01126.1 hypothetical protein CY652_17745 [Burkholderia sp. WAC0059]
MSENKPDTESPDTSRPASGAAPGTPSGDAGPAHPADDVPVPTSAHGASGLPADAGAAQRAATDAPASASALTPENPPPRGDEAAEARAEAAQTVARQEAEAEKAAGGGAQSGGEAAKAADAQEAAAAAAGGVGVGSMGEASSVPPGFGQPPDFTAQNPPPPGSLPPNPPRYLRPGDSAWSVFGRIVAARARQLFDRAGRRITQRTLRIGVSARIFHPEPGALGLRGKTLQYLEESIAHWVMSRDVIVFMIPTVGHQGMLHPSNIRLRDYAKHLDGLLLQGGADVSPQTYAEASARPEWPGDRVRDMYELELLHEFVESGKPVLGVCRGCQLINVAFGGTLYQDIATDVPTAGVHVNEQYDQHRHAIQFPEGSTFASLFAGQRKAIVNSIHHQAVKNLGRDLSIEAVSAGDGLVEAVRHRRSPFVVGVQWHPEFHRAGGPELLDCTPLLDTFLRSARETRF